MFVNSTDGVQVAVHDLAGHDPNLPVLLMSHATGFHGRCYLPLARVLADRFHSVGLDYRGHGDTPQPAGVPVDWSRNADDVEAVALSLTRPLIAFGHSMGGACLLMAAHRHPDLFSRLVIFEPIVFDPSLLGADEGPPDLAKIARRRRTTFASIEAAIANFASKPPLGSFTPEALDAYVRYGFREGDDGQVHLKCTPELEAATFEASRNQITWDLLPEISVPVLVACGVPEPESPAAHARSVADRLPNGTYVDMPELDHFGPMTHPDLIGALFG
ncbi:MAG TPA: alpha/beta hydrolase [Ilumatobacteraceae bacterium]|nr:alpha/beta hydrolase [Ilumatobacteraceae bacterium]